MRKGFESHLVWECLKDDDDHSKTIYKLIEKKDKTLKTKNTYERKQKLAAYIIRKGYKSSVVWDALNEMDNLKQINPAFQHHMPNHQHRQDLEQCKILQSILRLWLRPKYVHLDNNE